MLPLAASGCRPAPGRGVADRQVEGLAPASTYRSWMSRPKQFETRRFVGDKRTQVVHDLDNTTEGCEIADLLAAQTYVSFGPDTVVEASNRSYRPCRHCLPS